MLDTMTVSIYNGLTLDVNIHLLLVCLAALIEPSSFCGVANVSLVTGHLIVDKFLCLSGYFPCLKMHSGSIGFIVPVGKTLCRSQTVHQRSFIIPGLKRYPSHFLKSFIHGCTHIKRNVVLYDISNSRTSIEQSCHRFSRIRDCTAGLRSFQS